jgi:hypothetical protein
MPASQIAPQSALPKQIGQFMLGGLPLAILLPQPQFSDLKNISHFIDILTMGAISGASILQKPYLRDFYP